MPSTIRYAPPASLSAENAVAEDAMIADTPSAAPVTCTNAPTSVPSTAARPPTRPWLTLWETM